MNNRRSSGFSPVTVGLAGMALTTAFLGFLILTDTSRQSRSATPGTPTVAPVRVDPTWKAIIGPPVATPEMSAMRVADQYNLPRLAQNEDEPASGTCEGESLKEPLVPLPGHEYSLALVQVETATQQVNEDASIVVPLAGNWEIEAWKGCIQVSLREEIPKPLPKQPDKLI